MSDKAVRLICARVNGDPLLIGDNKTGNCSECGRLVQFRPHAPTPHVLICVQCFPDVIEPRDEVVTTPEMIKDFVAHHRKKLQ